MGRSLLVVWDQIQDAYAAVMDFFMAGTGRKTLFFILLVMLAWVLTRWAAKWVTRRLVRLGRVEVALIHLLGRSLVILVVLGTMFVFGTLLFDANVAALLTTLGLVSLAVGFGLQNTIANIAGGISLAVDRPFRIGDQIRVGDIIGDVQRIGIRSTRILTRRKEFVVIPNRMLEERPITNYTMVYPDTRLDVPVAVSYDSDRRLAERILVEVGSSHPAVLHDPGPRVLLRQFAESAVQLELRCWITHPRSRNVITSDLLKAIKDRFDREGVEIPTPYRTILQKSDLPPPRRLGVPAALESVETPPRIRRVLTVLTEGVPSRDHVEYVVALTKALRAQLVAVFVTSRRGPGAADEGSRALSALEQAAEGHRIWVKPMLRSTDDVVHGAAEVAKLEGVDVIVVGLGRARFPFEWGRGHAAQFDMDRFRSLGVDLPIHVVPHPAQLNPVIVAELEEKIAARRGPEPKARAPRIEVSGPEPATSGVPAPPAEGLPPQAGEPGTKPRSESEDAAESTTA